MRHCRPALLLALFAVCLHAPAQAPTTASPAPAAPDQKIDQKTLLATARRAYYLPLDRGVQGFSCAVAIDWQPLLERATGKRISAKDATLTQLSAARVTLTDDILKGASVTSTFPDLKFQPQPTSPAGIKQNILDKMIAAAFAGWNPFLSDRILPMEATRYHFERAGTGYRLTLDGGTFFSILDLSADLRITHGESHLNGTVTDFTPQFDPSSHGWLLTALETSTDSAASAPAAPSASSSSASPASTPSPSSSASGSSSNASRTSFTYSYQFVGDMLIPKRVIVQVGDGLETPFDLHDCTLIKAAPQDAAATTKP
jgi:hypothetical protein